VAQCLPISHSYRRAHAPAARKSTDIGLNFALTKENNYFFYPKKPHLWLSIILGIVGVCLLLFVIVIIHTLSGGGGVGGAINKSLAHIELPETARLI
jgi:hypothetical protein